MRGTILPGVLLGFLTAGCHTSSDVSPTSKPQEAPVLITKAPASYVSHTFDPAAPPPEMPPLGSGESAECDSDFQSNASARGQPRKTDATHAILTITQVLMTLRLQINVWLPTGAPQIIADHEEGHRQIAEYSYQTADKLARSIATRYIGERIEVTGADLDAESMKMLLEVATEISNEYGKEINAEPTQLLYDSITDHARNGVIAKDAVDHAIKNAAVEAAPAAN